MQPTLTIRFYCSRTGKEPVREWLKADISVDARKAIGADIKTVQFGWPVVGMPIVRKMEADPLGSPQRYSRRHRQGSVYGGCFDDGAVARFCEEKQKYAEK